MPVHITLKISYRRHASLSRQVLCCAEEKQIDVRADSFTDHLIRLKALVCAES